MIGYWCHPEKTHEVILEACLFAGDVGRRDADGNVYIRGRTSERFMVAGEAWYPREVAEAQMEHPQVATAALIGLPDANLGDKPIVYLIMRDSVTVTDSELHRIASSGLGRDLGVDEVQRVNSLPMTPTGKISKAESKAPAPAAQASVGRCSASGRGMSGIGMRRGC